MKNHTLLYVYILTILLVVTACEQRQVDKPTVDKLPEKPPEKPPDKIAETTPSAEDIAKSDLVK